MNTLTFSHQLASENGHLVSGGIGYSFVSQRLEQLTWKEQSRELTFEQIKNLIDERIEEIVEKKVREKIDDLLKERKTFSFRKVSKSVAKKEITLFILKKQKVGIFQVSILDLVLALKLPALQIEETMKDFLKKGKVKEL